MTTNEEISQAAYELAWPILNDSKDLTPDERYTGHERLRTLIEGIVKAGERDPRAVAHAALGLLRQNEQISRSKARVAVAPS